jgi:SAM-dependent methyltransferase
MRYLSEFDASKCGGHERRYALSVEWLEPLLSPGAVVYDCGRGEWPLPAMLRRTFAADIRNTGEADLRYPFPILSDVADGVICTEVIEHMKDRVEDDITTFTYSGVHNLLSECLRILKPGGWLFLSTPNLSSYGCLWGHMKGDSPTWYKPHVHELGCKELRWFLTAAGFVVERFEGVDVWPPQEYLPQVKHVADMLCPGLPRESCLFVLGRKPCQ